MGTPCHSFARARDRPGGPPRLRSDERPLGNPDLRPYDQLKVTQGHRLMRFSCRVLLIALQLHVPFTLENHRNSRLWLCPGVKKSCCDVPQTQLMLLLVCFWDCMEETYRIFRHTSGSLSSPTLFMCWYKAGICAHTGNPRIPLMGLRPSGVWMTKVAEPYPLVLCRKLAQFFATLIWQQLQRDS